MIQVAQKLYSFEEYLNYHDDTDLKYELFDGELIPIPLASGLHVFIMTFLYQYLDEEITKLNLNCKIMPGIIGVRTDERKSRIPDLVILTPEQYQELRSMPYAVFESPPLLAIEVVSLDNSDVDYRYKRSEYAVRGIPEYWIVDPIELKVSILTLVSGFYEVVEFTGNKTIISPTFTTINLTPEEIFNV